MHPCGNEDEPHTGLFQQGHSQQVREIDYSLLFCTSEASDAYRGLRKKLEPVSSQRCKKQQAQVSSKEFPMRNIEKKFPLRMVKHWDRCPESL